MQKVEVRGSTDTFSLLHVSKSAQRCHAVTVAMLRSQCRKRISGCFEDEGTRDEAGVMLWPLYPSPRCHPRDLVVTDVPLLVGLL